MPDIVPHFEVGGDMLKQIAQSMLEAKKMGRSLENTADAMIPLTDNEQIKNLLQKMSTSATTASLAANEIYHIIAREAMRP